MKRNDLCFYLQPPPICEEKQQESAMEELKGILVKQKNNESFISSVITMCVESAPVKSGENVLNLKS